MGRHLLIVYTNPVEGEEDEYNKWYDETHVPDLIAIPGVASAQRLQLTPLPGAGDGPAHKYLALYEIDGDPAAVMTELGQRVGSGEISMSSALDTSKMSLSIYSYREPDSA
jgi:hypothetical protein